MKKKASDGDASENGLCDFVISSVCLTHRYSKVMYHGLLGFGFFLGWQLFARYVLYAKPTYSGFLLFFVSYLFVHGSGFFLGRHQFFWYVLYAKPTYSGFFLLFNSYLVVHGSGFFPDRQLDQCGKGLSTPTRFMRNKDHKVVSSVYKLEHIFTFYFYKSL